MISDISGAARPSAERAARRLRQLEEFLDQDRDRSSDGVGIGEVRDSGTSKSRDETQWVTPVSPQRCHGGCRHGAGERVFEKVNEALRHHLGRGGL